MKNSVIYLIINTIKVLFMYRDLCCFDKYMIMKKKKEPAVISYCNLPAHFLSIPTKQRTCSPPTPPALHLPPLLANFLLGRLRTERKTKKEGCQLQRDVFYFTEKSWTIFRKCFIQFFCSQQYIQQQANNNKNHPAKARKPRASVIQSG